MFTHTSQRTHQVLTLLIIILLFLLEKNYAVYSKNCVEKKYMTRFYFEFIQQCVDRATTLPDASPAKIYLRPRGRGRRNECVVL